MLKIPPHPNAEQVKTLRESTGAGMMECKRQLTEARRFIVKRELLAALERGEDMREIVRHLIEEAF